MQTRTWMMVGAVTAAAVAAAVWMGTGDAPELQDAATSDVAAPQAGIAASAIPPELHAMTPDQVRNRLFEQGSFSGTEPAGDWCVQGGQLSPCPELRRRFEYYILAVGEVAVDDIRKLTADEARKAHGDKLAGEIMAIWAKYWELRNHTWRNKLEPGDLRTWMPAHEEQRQVRQRLLGADWAEAFFAEEDRQFKAYYEKMQSGAAAPPDPGAPVPRVADGANEQAVQAERVARYGQAAADRLAHVDAQWADWERRLAAARQAWRGLQSAPELSDLQRRQSMQAHIDQHFTRDEHGRVKALLRL